MLEFDVHAPSRGDSQFCSLAERKCTAVSQSVSLVSVSERCGSIQSHSLIRSAYYLSDYNFKSNLI